MIHDYALARADAREAAEAGDADAAFRLAAMCGLGLGGEQSYAEAVRWYARAAHAGDARAQCNLGFMYGTGRGVPQDYEQAYAWYNVAAAAGEDLARRNREAVAQRMSRSQLERAQQHSRELFAAIGGG